ncbi:hypothetical protein GCM10027284_46340 [Cyclobacterium sediminis]
MKNLHLFNYAGSFFLLVFLLTVAACDEPTLPEPDIEEEIVGQIGNPQFNLKFTNGDNVDLDLYVQTPNGTIINYFNTSGQGGQLDVDCLCGDCPNGPNENIYWEIGSAPSGTYKFWVEYYSSCDITNNLSEYTLRVINNGTIVQTYTGALSESNAKSNVYSIQY